ncbi:hypothetical protein K435DRAFT_782513 [Dendrothele bispora CBS 962.96]|uniref:Mid2 domain-containing protein n=1 Tax=Dendrothele bispora (strain CBS 962.96) TaxID=1314807 RepID=A0A4S8LEE9_DENBC|nr:hypothetical protein K435DRAFT_782513 [Dendrothele bispora CBS 962.96]
MRLNYLLLSRSTIFTLSTLLSEYSVIAQLGILGGNGVHLTIFDDGRNGEAESLTSELVLPTPPSFPFSSLFSPVFISSNTSFAETNEADTTQTPVTSNPRPTSEASINNIPEPESVQPQSSSSSTSTKASSPRVSPTMSSSFTSTDTSFVSLSSSVEPSTTPLPVSSSSLSTTPGVEPSTTSSPNFSNGEAGTKNTAAVVGIVFGCCGIAIVLICLTIFLRRRRQNKPLKTSGKSVERDSDTSGHLASQLASADERAVLVTEPSNSDSGLPRGFQSPSEPYLRSSESHASSTESPISPSTTHQKFITEDPLVQMRELEGAIAISNDGVHVQDLRATLSVIMEQIRRSNGQYDPYWTREFMDEPPPEYAAESQ